MFYERFEKLCRERGYAPGTVVVAIGRSKNLASKWKSTNATPSPEVMKELSDFFGVPVGYFLDETDDTESTRQLIFENYGQRVLFDTSKGCPSSQLIEWASMIEKWKEEHLSDS